MTTGTTRPGPPGPPASRGSAGPVPAASGTARRGDLAAALRLDGPVVAEVDLDTDPGTPPHRRNPLLLAVTALAVLGLVGGSALRSAVTAPPAPTGPAVTAWASLRDAGPGRADVLVTVATGAGRDRRVTAVEVGGARAAGAAGPVDAAPSTDQGVAPDRAAPGTVPVPLPLTVPPDGLATTVVRVPLSCGAPAGPKDGAGLTVAVRVDGTAVTVPAVLVGALAAADGACRAAAAATPTGAGDPVEVLSARVDGDVARVVVTLPPDATVDGADAGGDVVRVDDGAGAGAGRRTLVLHAPACPGPAPVDGTVPVGLRLRVTAGGRTTDRYAAVGPVLARWLVSRSCG